MLSAMFRFGGDGSFFLRTGSLVRLKPAHWVASTKVSELFIFKWFDFELRSSKKVSPVLI